MGKRKYKVISETPYNRIWDEKNNKKLASEITVKSRYKASWKCDKGHKYQQAVTNRTRNSVDSCPVCANKIIVPGINDMFTTHPALKEVWDEKNNTIDPTTVSSGTEKKLWWKCDKGHSYQQSGDKKAIRGYGCPVCSGKKVVHGVNDVATTHPKVLDIWSKDNTISPYEVTAGSEKKVQWVCSRGHVTTTPVYVKIKSGFSCVVCMNKKIISGDNDLATTRPDGIVHWDYEKNDILPTEISYGSKKKVWWKCDKGHSFYMAVHKKSAGQRCPHCVHGEQQSSGEKEVLQFVRGVLPDEVVVESNNRDLLQGKELDIYIPDKNIAIEFNGLYWHSEQAGKTRNYHKKKWEKCQEKGVQLITVWEDDWRDKKGVVKSMLAHKLGVSGGARVFARKTVIKPVDSATARKFCDSYHIQGACGGTCYLGLYTKNGNELVAMSVWRKNKKDIYLDRYCTSQTVVGGFSKLLKHATALFTQDGFNRIITFADREVSDGSLYERTGFKVDSYLPPDYRYVREGTRYHKFGFRLKRFKNDPELLYREGLTEGQLAELNGMIRVWDCGKIKYVL